MIVVSVCLPSDALSQCLPSYLGFSYLGHGVRGLLQQRAAAAPDLGEGLLLLAVPAAVAAAAPVAIAAK